jgi:hypothetical protein
MYCQKKKTIMQTYITKSSPYETDAYENYIEMD